MSKFHRAYLVVAVVASLAAPAHAKPTCYFGECGNNPERGAPPSNACSGPRTVSKVGSWELLVDCKGHKILYDKFDNGSTLMIGVFDGVYRIGLTHPSWHYREGQIIKASITINGKTFDGRAKATSSDTVVIDNVLEQVMKSMFNGDRAMIRVADYSWDLNMEMAKGVLDSSSHQN